MINLIRNPGFETSDAWALAGVAEYVVTPVHAGTRSLRMRAAWSAFGPISLSSTAQQTLALMPGGIYPLTFWVNANGSAGCQIRLEFEGASVWTEAGGADGAVWRQITVNVQPFTSSPVIRFVTTQPASGPPSTCNWYIDDMTLEIEEGQMAVFLGEFAVRAMLATLQTSLNLEIVGITSERQDAVALPAVSKWYAFERDEDFSPDTVDVSVNEVETAFPSYPRDLSTWLSGQRSRVSSQVVLTVRLSHANRDNVSTSVMWTRSKRYEAAIVRTIRNAPGFGYGFLYAYPQRSRAGVAGNASLKHADRVDVQFVVEMQETATGEMSAGGGVPPACTLES